MIADVSAPDLETRVAILQTKCQEKGLTLSQEVLELVASTVQSNIRELEGALNKISVFHQIKNSVASLESVKSMLASFESQSMKKSVTPRQIISTVGSFYDIEIDQITGKSREKKISLPRQIIMYLLRTELQMSYPAIGNELGGRDHTTAIHAQTKIEELFKEDMKIKQDIELIKQQLYAQSIK
jgi:chromosomal replication initiator protein